MSIVFTHRELNGVVNAALITILHIQLTDLYNLTYLIRCTNNIFLRRMRGCTQATWWLTSSNLIQNGVLLDHQSLLERHVTRYLPGPAASLNDEKTLRIAIDNLVSRFHSQ